MLVGCANNMVLFEDDVAGYNLKANNLPNTTNCQIIKNAYRLGATVTIKKGTRWVDGYPEDHHNCPPTKKGSCETVTAKATHLNQSGKQVLKLCRIEAAEAAANATDSTSATDSIDVYPNPVVSDTKRNLAFESIRKGLKKASTPQKPIYPDLSLNMSNFVLDLIKEADITDMIGTTVLGTSDIPNDRLKRNHISSYQVLQVNKDKVLLDCSNCRLPTIAIIRKNGRPSPIENQIFNDQRAVYRFAGTEHYLTVAHEKRQMIMFERITMEELGLPLTQISRVVR